MVCNGKMYPYKSDVSFEIIAFGSEQKGKLLVQSTYDKQALHWKLRQIDLKTKHATTNII